MLAPLVISATADATVYRVKQFATPPSSPDGSSWSNAFPSIDAAFAAVQFQTGDELWIAASGSTPYHPTQNVTAEDPRSGHFKIDQSKVHIKGGFPSNPPNGWAQRDLAVHATILSGDLNDDDPPYDPETYDDTVGELHDNSYQVVKVFGVDGSCVIDGLVIRDAHGWNGVVPQEGDPGYLDTGGGMELRSDMPGEFATPYIQNCKFLDNFASLSGGAISIMAKVVPVDPPWMHDPANYLSSVKIRTCEFRANRVKSGTGGAIDLWGGGLDIAGSLIADNYANSRGCGIHAFMPQPLVVTNCTITNNNASHPICGIAVGMALLQEENPQNLLIVRNSIVSGNRDDQEGGGSGSQDNQIGPSKLGSLPPLQMDYSIMWGSVVNEQSPFGEGNQTTACYDPDFFYDRDNQDVFLRDYRVRRTTFPRGPVDLGDADTSVLPLDERDADDDGITSIPELSEELPDVRRAERIVAALQEEPARVDIGAYEMTQAETSIVAPLCVGDLDFDGFIGAPDLAILLGGWGAWDTECAADLDLDGEVDAADLAILLGMWGAECPGAPGTPQGFAAMSSASGFALTPSDLAVALGFESIDALATWLGTLSPESRAAVLGTLSLAGGEM